MREAEQQKLREEERKELEAQIAKVKNDANISIEDKNKIIDILNQQIINIEADMYQQLLAAKRECFKGDDDIARSLQDYANITSSGDIRWVSLGKYSGYCVKHDY